MNRVIVFLVLCCLSLLVSGCAQSTAPEVNTEKKETAETGMKGVVTTREPSMPAGRYMLPDDFASSLREGITVVYFGKIACPSCAKQDVIWQEVIKNLPAGTHAEKRFSYAIDPRKYGVHQLPTLVFYKNGIEYKRNVGVMQENDIYRSLKRG